MFAFLLIPFPLYYFYVNIKLMMLYKNLLLHIQTESGLPTGSVKQHIRDLRIRLIWQPALCLTTPLTNTTNTIVNCNTITFYIFFHSYSNVSLFIALKLLCEWELSFSPLCSPKVYIIYLIKIETFCTCIKYWCIYQYTFK